MDGIGATEFPQGGSATAGLKQTMEVMPIKDWKVALEVVVLEEEKIPTGCKRCFATESANGVSPTQLDFVPAGEFTKLMFDENGKLTGGDQLKEQHLYLPDFPADQDVFLWVTGKEREGFYRVKAEGRVFLPDAQKEDSLVFEPVNWAEIPKGAMVITADEATASAERAHTVTRESVEDLREEAQMIREKKAWQKVKEKGGLNRKPIRWVVASEDGKNFTDVIEWDESGRRGLEMPDINELLPKLAIEVPADQGQNSFYRIMRDHIEGDKIDVRFLQPISKEEAETADVVGVDEIRQADSDFGKITMNTMKWERRWASRKAG